MFFFFADPEEESRGKVIGPRCILLFQIDHPPIGKAHVQADFYLLP